MYMSMIFAGHDELLKSRKSEAHDDGTEEIVAQANFGKGWVDLPKMLLLLVSYITRNKLQ